jgi:hypothetical protein
MQTIRKNYPITTHVVHSRLQLLRNKVKISENISASEFVMLNLPLFESIRDSVDTYHHYKPGRSEYQGAAELFLSTIDDQQKEIESQPLWEPKNNH